ncbi:unnamed protein product [Effrenium voratum]|nr:unnamed protein product [Effrenium voratum]
MEDGVRPAEDGEPDVFFSHSYTDNCRRVDMALFECNCPNSLTCCSHLYAAVVALPEYRHRAALLWAMRQELRAAAGGNEHRSRGALVPDFQAARRRLKVALLRRLNLEELAESALDASLGLWARVDWLRRGERPKLEKYWAQNLEKVLVGRSALESGKVLQERVQGLLEQLRMSDSELGPLLLALAKGQCDEKRLQWSTLSQRFWSQLAEDTKKSEEGSSRVEEVRLASVTAILEAAAEPGWEEKLGAERLWACEERLLKSLGATSFPALMVKKVAEFTPEHPRTIQGRGQLRFDYKSIWRAHLRMKRGHSCVGP